MRRLLNDFKDRLIRVGYQPCTAKSMGKNLSLFLRHIKTTDMRKVSHKDIEKYKAYLMTDYRMKDGNLISVKSVVSRLITLKKFFGFLAGDRKIFFDPTLGVAFPKIARGILPDYIPTEHDVEELIRKPDTFTFIGIRNRALFELMYTCPLRNKELRELTVGELDMKNKFIYPKRAKGGRECGIPMAESTHEILQKYLEIARPRLLKRAKESTDALFLGCRGEPFQTEQAIELIFAKYRTKKGVHPHAMRHACAVHMLRNGARIREIQVLLGHRNITSTQVYTRLTAADLKGLQDKYHPREGRNRDRAVRPVKRFSTRRRHIAKCCVQDSAGSGVLR